MKKHFQNLLQNSVLFTVIQYQVFFCGLRALFKATYVQTFENNLKSRAFNHTTSSFPVTNKHVPGYNIHVLSQPKVS